MVSMLLWHADGRWKKIEPKPTLKLFSLHGNLKSGLESTVLDLWITVPNSDEYGTECQSWLHISQQKLMLSVGREMMDHNTQCMGQLYSLGPAGYWSWGMRSYLVNLQKKYVQKSTWTYPQVQISHTQRVTTIAGAPEKTDVCSRDSHPPPSALLCSRIQFEFAKEVLTLIGTKTDKNVMQCSWPPARAGNLVCTFERVSMVTRPSRRVAAALLRCLTRSWLLFSTAFQTLFTDEHKDGSVQAVLVALHWPVWAAALEKTKHR